MISKNCSDLIFYLDGAHSPESMEACAKWFSNEVKTAREPTENSDTQYESKTLGEFEKSFKQV